MDEIRKQIVETVKKLAAYELGVWKQAGPYVQNVLTDRLAKLTSSEIDRIKPLALAVWGEALNSDLRGTTWNADSVVLHSGAVPVSDELKEIRQKAIRGLFELFVRSKADAEKSAISAALDEATRTPTQANYSNELLQLTLENASQIVRFYSKQAPNLSFELLQHLEHGMLYDYRRARPLAAQDGGRFNAREMATELLRSIETFRDLINQNEDYVRYKVLVGYESVFAGHWLDDDFDYKESEQYRAEQSERYVEAINSGNEAHWFQLINRFASTKSNDLATFPVFANFLVRMAEKCPEFALRLVDEGSEDLQRFLPAFLAGLLRSSRPDIYSGVIQREFEKGVNYSAIARHLRNENVRMPELVDALLHKAVRAQDDISVIETLTLLLERWGTGAALNEQADFELAIRYLTSKHDARWIRLVWFQPKIASFYELLSDQNAKLLLTNLVNAPKIDYQLERILEHIAATQLGLIWDYFGRRLAHERKSDDGARYEAIPYEFHGLQKQLSRDPELAINAGRGWYAHDKQLFRFRGGRLLSISFPECADAFSRVLIRLVEDGNDDDADFVLEVMQNYHGEPATHGVLKAIVARYPSDERKLNKVSISFDNTGVVSGEFGMVEAHRAKKVAIETWLKDPRLAVREFATKHIANLNLRIAYEQKRAEEQSALRRLDYKKDDASDET